MEETEDLESPARVKAALVDPDSMLVVWMNEAAAHSVAGHLNDSASGVAIDQLVPMAEELGMPAALRAAADSGASRHLQTDLVSTVRGSVAILISIYRLPHGELLVLMENAWQPRHVPPGDGTRRRTGRGAR